MNRRFAILALLGAAVVCDLAYAGPQFAAPVSDGLWLRPADGPRAEPVWGIKDGIAIGLWPTSGPRGLIRIYAPYLGQRRPRMVNYISIEPVVKGVRGQSELEAGRIGKGNGVAMWTADTLEAVQTPREPAAPARGKVERVGGHESLSFYLATEPFRNGAHPILEVILRQDRPHEVGLRIHAAKASTKMDSCVL